jgi:hypothetical protein
MIIKELDPLELNDKFEQAGYSAESQLAFYLKREFKTDPHILIFNHLRFEKAGDVCQIDHLVLHQYGMVIIESKSVTTRIEINELGEWKRCFNNTWRGMPSPVLQAQRQGKFLREYLEDNVEKLLNKLIFGKQVHFTKMPIDVLVAISDSGIINRPQNNPLDNVCKADQIADKVKAKVAEYRKKNGLLSLSDPVHEFNKDEIQRISKFLLAHHKPAKAKASLTITDPKPTNSPLLDPQNSFSISTPLITPEKLVLPQKRLFLTLYLIQKRLSLSVNQWQKWERRFRQIFVWIAKVKIYQFCTVVTIILNVMIVIRIWRSKIYVRNVAISKKHAKVGYSFLQSA